MRIGVVFPQTEISRDLGAARAYAVAAEALGYDHLLAYDHVVGVDPAVHVGWDGYYDIDDSFHEPLVLFGYLAACTTTLELVTGILILPQRQTVLVAKQAATVDHLSGGRLRLGVGLGWNAVEYDALDVPFAGRGTRMEQQVHLLRRLWTERSVSEAAGGDRLDGVGIAPPPVQQPIPIWVGGATDAALARAGRIADGWLPMLPPSTDVARRELERGRDIVETAARSVGRDPASIGLEGRVPFDGDVDALAGRAAVWRELGATHLSVNTMRRGYQDVDAHIAALSRAIEVLRTDAVDR